MRGRASPGALQEWSCCGMLGLHEAFCQACRALPCQPALPTFLKPWSRTGLPEVTQPVQCLVIRAHRQEFGLPCVMCCM